MGTVWLAQLLGRRAAIKVLHPSLTSRLEIVARFGRGQHVRRRLGEPTTPTFVMSIAATPTYVMAPSTNYETCASEGEVCPPGQTLHGSTVSFETSRQTIRFRSTCSSTEKTDGVRRPLDLARHEG